MEEIATAQADLKCEESYVTDVEAKVRDEYEKKFAAQNAALITQAQTRLGVAK